jgi:CubicO group peptidase (beta-lactamase class C family)
VEPEGKYMGAVDGVVEPGFEAVAEVLAASDLGRGGAAFSAYVEGRQVVDLWAGEAAPGTPWVRDTLTTAMSATKGAAAACLLVLHDRGLIDVDAPVSKYWPEYAQAGKDGTLVRHVLNHTSGMLCVDDPGSVLDWQGNGWDDYDAIAAGIAASPPAWEPGTAIGYHAISVGWLCQELVRRVAGVTLGEFFDREIARPLGLSAFIGTPAREHARLAPIISDLPGEDDSPEVQALLAAFRAVMHNPAHPAARAAVLMHGETFFENPGFWNLPKVRSTEIPAANGSFDARSLAKLYALLAEGGELDGVRLASPSTVRLFGTKSFSAPSALSDGLSLPGADDMRYALGFEGDFGEAVKPWRFGPSVGAFGHLGAGGQIGFADTERRVSVGFVRNHHADWSVSTALVEALYAAL